MKKLRLRVSVTCQDHLQVSSSTEIWTKFFRGVHQPLADGNHVSSSRTFSRPQVQHILILPGPHPLFSVFPFSCFCHIAISDFILYMIFVQPILSQQIPQRHEAQESVRHSCFPPEAYTLRGAPTNRNTMWATYVTLKNIFVFPFSKLKIHTSITWNSLS